MLRGWGGELLRRDNMDKRKRKKEAYPPAGTSLQGFAHRSNYSCKSIPVREYLQTFSSDLFAAQRDDLCYHHVAYSGRYNYSCGSVLVSLYLWREGLYSGAKRRDMDKIATVMSLDALWS